MSADHQAGVVTDVRCRLFEAPTEGAGVRYANPLRGWDPSRDERGFAFPRWLVVEVETSTGIVGIGDAEFTEDEWAKSRDERDKDSFYAVFECGGIVA